MIIAKSQKATSYALLCFGGGVEGLQHPTAMLEVIGRHLSNRSQAAPTRLQERGLETAARWMGGVRDWRSTAFPPHGRQRYTSRRLQGVLTNVAARAHSRLEGYSEAGPCEVMEEGAEAPTYFNPDHDKLCTRRSGALGSAGRQTALRPCWTPDVAQAERWSPSWSRRPRPEHVRLVNGKESRKHRKRRTLKCKGYGRRRWGHCESTSHMCSCRREQRRTRCRVEVRKVHLRVTSVSGSTCQPRKVPCCGAGTPGSLLDGCGRRQCRLL